MPAWVAPQWEWYYRLWHDLCGLNHPFSFYLVKWPWTLVFGLGTILLVVGIWWWVHPTTREWVVISIVMAWCFLLGHLYFPAMN